MNHVTILEIPLIYARLQPRSLQGFVLADRWKNPVLAWGLDVCGAIPLERGGTNLASVRRGLEVLRAGKILIIMPEGTRSGDGRLQSGYPGVVLMAIKSGAPLLPVVTYGGEKYRENLKKLRRTDFYIAVGQPFFLNAENDVVDGPARKQMVDEVMYRMAALLPSAYRGVYGRPQDVRDTNLTDKPG
jgi:1-acyl-sn-glycerol-3-phosphate acyltransferase